MGDDTYHCIGSVMRTEAGNGIIGLHRGRSQREFSAMKVARLGDLVPHLHRMFAVRARLATANRSVDLFSALFDATLCPTFAVTPTGRIKRFNAAGEALIARADIVTIRSGNLIPCGVSPSADFDRALWQAGGRGEASASSCLLRSSRNVWQLATFTPLATAPLQGMVLVTIEPRPGVGCDLEVAHRLISVFKLTAAEANVAIRLTEGASVAEIGEARRSSSQTVRTQLKVLFAKLDAHRQSDIVRIVLSLA